MTADKREHEAGDEVLLAGSMSRRQGLLETGEWRGGVLPLPMHFGTFMFKQSGEFGRLTPRLGYNKLWFVISDLVRPGNDVCYS